MKYYSAYVFTLDSHDYYGPFRATSMSQAYRLAMLWAMFVQHPSYTIHTEELPFETSSLRPYVPGYMPN